MELSAGTKFGRYEIRSPIGAGGMGVVYLAQDPQLGRPVALKLLPANVTKGRERLSRFKREARATSKLNHPNIITIYEIGQVEATHFIAAEFIDGVTLRERMKRGPMNLSETFDVAIQIAAALSAAHAVGIVHRDVKPENIMVRGDGLVKVLDFGLAKLTGSWQHVIDPDTPTATLIDTDPGSFIGTIAYMSPEQLRGEDVDPRADVWSFGVVLYEMITGKMPFTGATKSDYIVAILERQELPLASFVPGIAPEAQRIVTKALRKNREERHGRMSDLLTDLRSLREEINFERLGRRAPRRKEADEGGADTAETIGDGRRDTLSEKTGTARYSLGTTRLLSVVKAHPKATFIAALLAAVILSLVLLGRIDRTGRTSEPGPRRFKVSKLTNTGNATRAAISPDGKYVAYAAEEAGRQSLWLRHVGTISDKQIVAPAAGEYRGLVFSPDGSYIYFVQWTKDERSLYGVPVLGGPPRKLINDVDGPPSVSPDGRFLAFVRLDKNSGGHKLIVALADGSGERVIAARAGGNFFSPYSSAAWSPDGKTLTCAAGTGAGGLRTGLVEIEVESGAERSVDSRTWYQIIQLARPRDDRGLLVLGNEGSVEPFQLWFFSFADGRWQKVTSDAAAYYGLSVTADGNQLVTVENNRVSSVWVSPAADPNRARQIASSVGRALSASWAPDGKLLYAAVAGGNLDVWLMNPETSEKKQLTIQAGDNHYPRASPDGRYVVFSSNRSGSFCVWRMDVDGRNPKQLTTGGTDFYPAVSPDGRWVVYQNGQQDVTTIWKVGIDGGEAVQLTRAHSGTPIVSPDGKLIACRYREAKTGVLGAAVIPFAGGEPVNFFHIPISTTQRIRWGKGGRSLTYVETNDGVSNIWSQPLDGGRPEKLTNFNTHQIFSHDWSADGNELVCERGIVTNDVVLLSDAP